MLWLPVAKLLCLGRFFGQLEVKGSLYWGSFASHHLLEDTLPAQLLNCPLELEDAFKTHCESG